MLVDPYRQGYKDGYEAATRRILTETLKALSEAAEFATQTNPTPADS